MSTEKPTAVRVYLARVRTALADLPAGEVEEILEDVRPHLAEMEAELGASARVEALVEGLGTPESYAAELRAAGGYPAPPPGGDGATEVLVKPAAPSPVAPRIALWGMVTVALGMALLAFSAAVSVDPDPLVGVLVLAPVFAVSLWLLMRRGIQSVLDLPEVGKLRESMRTWREGRGERSAAYLGALTPAWWLLCAAVLVLFGLLLMVRNTYAAALLPFLVVAAVAVVWAGPRTRRDRRLLWLAVPISAFVVGGVFGGLGAAIEQIDNRGSYYAGNASYSTPATDDYGNQQLSYGDEELRNVYAFDSDGKPLKDVYLYDEQGRPLTITRYGCEQDTGTTATRGSDNRFPRPKIVEGVQDDRGNLDGYNSSRSYCREDDGVPFAAAIPKPGSSTPTPSGTPSPGTPAPGTQPSGAPASGTGSGTASSTQASAPSTTGSPAKPAPPTR
ncbi:DUF1700 domain-containing protein [Amycolatopsis jiangsuensis]|uniref:Putative membrane protein n=1 Tax=Amycolatopsis jiangsuensis TaxID=1181879 RepID=A0A840IX05_9PSEU|nr:hypothetical protein [Amycolatopsis jiangsuensis]MBB4685434.1 putative membrane protein [Amycolatopsis jiangsuensis]